MNRRGTPGINVRFFIAAFLNSLLYSASLRTVFWINVKKLWKIRIKLSGMTSNLRSVQKRLRKVLIISLNYPFNLHYWLLLFIPRSAKLNSSLTSMAVPSHVGYNNNSPEHFQNEVLLQQGGRNLSLHCFSQHFLRNFSFFPDGMHIRFEPWRTKFWRNMEESQETLN